MSVSDRGKRPGKQAGRGEGLKYRHRLLDVRLLHILRLPVQVLDDIETARLYPGKQCRKAQLLIGRDMASIVNNNVVTVRGGGGGLGESASLP